MADESVATCDVCGKPATNWATDILAYANWQSGFVEKKPIGVIKRGCDEHRVESEEYETNYPFMKR